MADGTNLVQEFTFGIEAQYTVGLVIPYNQAVIIGFQDSADISDLALFGVLQRYILYVAEYIFQKTTLALLNRLHIGSKELLFRLFDRAGTE